uniref:WD_REPEATS_REGION domain-containing protein n=1 Tax=Panagrellus redivivus TaxID=6233 RepID=A0A7E4WBZ4_PANRE
MEHQITVISADIIENAKVLVFDCRLQVAVIIIVERFVKFGEIEYRLDFTYPEIPVYFAIPTISIKATQLFSVDSVGRISRWVLLPKNRKIRSHLMCSGVENSFVAFSLQGNRFMVATSKGVNIIHLTD